MFSSKNLKKELKKEDVDNFLSKLHSETILIIPHESTDHDAYGASYALKMVLEQVFKDDKRIFVVMPQPSLELNDFIKKLSLPSFENDLNVIMESLQKGKLVNYDTILVDISDKSRFTDPDIDEIVSKSNNLLIVDHHYADAVYDSPSLIVERTSASEVILDIIGILGLDKKILGNEKLCDALIGGILIDTSFLYYATTKTFSNLAFLSECGNYRRVYSTLRSVRREIAEKIARIKGAKRAEMIRINDFIILVTYVGSYEASVASALINLGANVALVISKKKTRGKIYYRVTGRGSGVNLALIFNKIAEKIGGSGGGHPSAAGLVIEESKVADEKHLAKIVVRELLDSIV